MARLTVVHRCGHTLSHTAYASQADVVKRKAILAAQDCPKCHARAPRTWNRMAKPEKP